MIDINRFRTYYEPVLGRKILDSHWRANLRKLLTQIEGGKKIFFHPLMYELVKQMKERETIHIGFKGKDEYVNRGGQNYSIKYLIMNWCGLGFFQHPTNLYYSLSILTQFPVMSYNFKTRNEQMKAFGDDFKKYVMDVDYLIDIDPSSGEFNQSIIDQSIELCELFDKFNLTYEIRTSGKGLHLYLTGKQFTQSIYLKPKLYRQISTNLKELMGFSQIDSASFYENADVSRRICKLPFSLDCKSEIVDFPLTKKELKNIDITQYTPENILKNRKLYKYLIPIHNSDKQSKIKEFIEYIQPD